LLQGGDGLLELLGLLVEQLSQGVIGLLQVVRGGLATTSPLDREALPVTLPRTCVHVVRWQFVVTILIGPTTLGLDIVVVVMPLALGRRVIRVHPLTTCPVLIPSTPTTSTLEVLL
jgi:hypothetical protein